MDKTSSEIFGNFVYDESLTYDELLHTEETLTSAIEDLLKRAGAEHVDFTPMGDSLMLQCSCQGHKIYIFRKLACELAEILPQKISGRICCLSHGLDTCHVYWLNKMPGRKSVWSFLRHLSREPRNGGPKRPRKTFRAKYHEDTPR